MEATHSAAYVAPPPSRNAQRAELHIKHTYKHCSLRPKLKVINLVILRQLPFNNQLCHSTELMKSIKCKWEKSDQKAVVISKKMTTFWWNFFWNVGPKSVDICPRALHAAYRTLGCYANNTPSPSYFSMQINGLVITGACTVQLGSVATYRSSPSHLLYVSSATGNHDHAAKLSHNIHLFTQTNSAWPSLWGEVQWVQAIPTAMW